jgi:hypothetical protein
MTTRGPTPCASTRAQQPVHRRLHPASVPGAESSSSRHGPQSLISAQIANALGLRYLVVRDKRTGKVLRVTAAMAPQQLEKGEEVIEVWSERPQCAGLHRFNESRHR